jgi:hypothetical protein
LPASAQFDGKDIFLYFKAHIMKTETKQRYRWVKPSDLPERVELIDNVTSHQVATITTGGRVYYWKRSTSVLLHGVPSAEGSTSSLTQAKNYILEGLHD